MVEIHLVIRDAVCDDPQAAKEGVCMALEPLGNITVLECRVRAPKQMKIGDADHRGNEPVTLR